jgi:hypothetical protein
MLAVDDLSGEAEVAAQHRRGVSDPPLGDGLADPRGRGAGALHRHHVHLPHLQPGQQAGQLGDGAAALAAEAEVVPHHQGGGPQAAGEDLVGEPLGGLRGELQVEGLDHDLGDPHLAQQVDLVVQRGDPRGAAVRLQHRPGRGIEGEDAGGHAAGLRRRDHLGEQVAVPQVHPVEVADRHHRAGLGRGVVL